MEGMIHSEFWISNDQVSKSLLVLVSGQYGILLFATPFSLFWDFR